MTTPIYVTTSRGQLRLFTAGEGPTLIILAGLARGAEIVAEECAKVLARRRVIVVELPGIGGSARTDVASLPEAAAVIIEAVDSVQDGPVTLAAFDLATALLPDVAAGLNTQDVALVDVDSAKGWAASSMAPPSPEPQVDGTHLTALWVFLRDRRLLEAEDATQPRMDGPPLPSVDDLARSFVAATTEPSRFVRLWQQCLDALPDALAMLDPARNVTAVADLPEPERTVVDSPMPMPVTTAPQKHGEVWHEYVETPHGRAHVRRCGTEGRPLLVLPTGGGSSAQFEPVIRGLGEDRQAVSIDYFGNGLSEATRHSPTVMDLADDAFAVADALGWDSFDVWGSHTGACTALEMSVQRPQRIGRGIFEAPVVISPEFRADIQANYFPDLTPDAFGTHVQRAWHWRRDVFAYWPWYHVDYNSARTIGMPSADELQKYAAGILESGESYDGAYRAAFDYDTRARLPQLTKPGLLVAGPHDMLSNALQDAMDLVPDNLLEVRATPETVWWPHPEPEASAETFRIYKEFLG